MALTDHCDVYAAFHEDAFNRILYHLQRQRPSMFNHATRQIAENPEMLCSVIDAHPIVGLRHNPLVTIVDPLPIPGTEYGLNFALQVTGLQIDFHPGSQFALPPQLTPLGAQRFAVRLSACGGIGCPSRDVLDKLVPPPKHQPRKEDDRSVRVLTALPATELTCFSLDAFLVGSFRIKDYDGKSYLEPVLEGFEIVDITPQGLEDSLECYVQALLRLVILPQMRFLLDHAPMDIIKNVLAVKVGPVPVSPSVPYNPAIEEDQIKAFIKVEVA